MTDAPLHGKITSLVYIYIFLFVFLKNSKNERIKFRGRKHRGMKIEERERRGGGDLCKLEQLKSDACAMTAVSQIPSQPLTWKKRY